jgi:hypothetical protein
MNFEDQEQGNLNSMQVKMERSPNIAEMAAHKAKCCISTP